MDNSYRENSIQTTFAKWKGQIVQNDNLQRRHTLFNISGYSKYDEELNLSKKDRSTVFQKYKLTSLSFSLATVVSLSDLSPPMVKMDLFWFKYFPFPQPSNNNFDSILFCSKIDYCATHLYHIL